MREACGQQLSQANFFPAESVQIPQVTEYKDEPNGMVAQTVYGLLNITVQPSVGQVYESPILKLDEEVDTAAIRASYPEAWEDAAQTHRTGRRGTGQRAALSPDRSERRRRTKQPHRVHDAHVIPDVDQRLGIQQARR
jgi:hypothetical protein